MALQPLYPNRYVWFVFLSTMDLFLTFIVLWFGGREANKAANWVLQNWGFAGMTLFKFALVVVVIGLCEIAGRRNPAAGRLLINVGLVITCFPLAVAFYLLLREVHWS